MKKKFVAGDFAILLLTLLFLVGITFWFPACDPKEDGSYMTCHWAEVAVRALSLCMLAVGVLHAIANHREVKKGLALSLFPMAIVALLLPGRLIPLCMMQDMQCHTLMTPGILLCCLLILLAAAADLFLLKKGS